MAQQAQDQQQHAQQKSGAAAQQAPQAQAAQTSELAQENPAMASATGRMARLGIFCTLLGGMFWGLSGTCSKFLMENYAVDPIWLVCIRQLCASVLFIVPTLIKSPGTYRSLAHDTPMLRRLVWACLAGTMVNSVAYLCAVDATDSGTATILQQTSIALVLIYGCITLHRAPKKRELAGVALALVGTFLIATHGDPTQLHMDPAGLAWGLVCAAGAAIMGIGGRPILAKYGSMAVNGAQMLVVGGVLALVTQPWAHPVTLDAAGWAMLAFTVVVGTFLAYALYFKGVSLLGAYKAGLLGTIEPVTATVATVLMMGTAFTPAELAGFACILIMVFITT
jgi:drug/metabolite transporter (DMT)-like permease